MRREWKTRRVVVDIATDMTVDADGEVKVETITMSHGNAKHLSLFWLQGYDDGTWAISEHHGERFIVATAESKKEALDKIMRRAEADAARWAIG